MNIHTLFPSQHHRILSLLTELAPLLRQGDSPAALVSVDDKWSYLSRWARVQFCLDESARQSRQDRGFDPAATMLAVQAASLDSVMASHDARYADPAAIHADPQAYLAATGKLAAALRNHLQWCVSGQAPDNARHLPAGRPHRKKAGEFDQAAYGVPGNQ